MTRARARAAVGRTGIALSRLGFGTMAIGGQYEDVSDDDARATLAAALAGGITYFDTAPQYGCGLAEERLGATLGSSPSKEIVVSTKVGKAIAPLGSGGQRQRDLYFPGGHDGEMVFDYSYDGTLRIVDDSLRRLGRDRVDMLLVHDVIRHFHGETGVTTVAREALGGAIKALHRLRDERVVTAIGTGLKDVDIAEFFVEEGDIDVVLVPGRVTLLDQSADASGLLDLCLKHEVAVIAAAPFDSGILVTGAVEGARYGYRRAEGDVLGRVKRMEAVCADFGVPLAAAALQFPLLHPAVASVVTGMKTAEEVRQNVVWMDAALPAGLWSDLAEAAGVRLPSSQA